MFLLASFPFFLYSIFLSKKSVSFYLAVLFGSSFVFAFISPLSQGVENLGDFLNLSLIVSLLLILVYSFQPYYAVGLKKYGDEPDFFWPSVYFLAVCLSLAFVLNSIIVSKSLSFILTEQIPIKVYKNQGLAHEGIRTWFNPMLVTFVNLLSPLGYVALGLHFYFLLKSKTTLALIFFMLSLNLPLNSLHGLSRSGLIHYLFVYFFMYVYIRPAISERIRNAIRPWGQLFVFALLAFLLFITIQRFGAGNYTARYNDLSSFWGDNAVLISMLDYGSQWISNALVVLRSYSLDNIWIGKSFRIFEIIANLLGFDYQNYRDIRKVTLGEYGNNFIGLFPVLIFDFGYILTVLLTLVFCFITRVSTQKNGYISKNNIFFFPFLIAAPAMFFTNNYYSNTALSVGMVLSVFYVFLLKLSFRRGNLNG